MSDEEGSADLALEFCEGVMQVLQVLVVCLGKSGRLDTAEYARLLSNWRETNVDRDSIQEAVIDRMLSMLVDQPEVLAHHMQAHLRRSGFQLVSAESPGLGTTAEDPFRGPESPG